MADERIDTVLRLTTEFDVQSDFDQLEKYVRSSTADWGRLELTLKKVQEAQNREKEGLALLDEQFKNGAINQGKYDDAAKTFADDVYSKAVPALAAYNRALDSTFNAINKLNTSPLSAAAVTPTERTGAVNFKSNDLPFLKEELAGIEARNQAMAASIKYAEEYDLVQAKAFKTYAPTIRQDIQAIEAQNVATAKAAEQWDVYAQKQQLALDKELGQNFTGLNKSIEEQDDKVKKLNISFAQLATAYYLLHSIASGMIEAAKRTIEFVTAANALSQILGITTTQASGFVFQAQELGVSVDTVTEAYRTFSDRLGRATGLFGEQNRGSRQMSEAMKSLGIDVLDTSGHVRSMGQIIPEVADAIQKLGPGIETTAIATALFGQRSDELIPSLLTGSAGMAHAAEVAAKLGFNLNAIETKQLRAANVELNDIQKSLDSIFLTEAKQAASGGILDTIANAFIDWAEKFDRWNVQVGVGVIELEGLLIGLGFVIKDVLSGEGFEKAAEQFKRARELATQEEERFANSRGFKFNNGSVLGRTSDDTGDILNGIPKPDESTLTALEDLFKRKQDIIDKYNLDEKNKTRDFLIDQTRTEEDFQHDRTEQYIDFLRDRADKTNDFNSKQLLKESEFSRDQARREYDFNSAHRDDEDKFQEAQLQKLDAYNQKRAEKIRDFEIDQRNRIQDFNESQSDRLYNYETNRSRIIEDALNRRLELNQRNAEAIVAIQEKAQQEMEALLARWDNIILRLQIGGDQDSLTQAYQARQDAIDQQNANTQDQIDAALARQQQEAAATEGDTALRLARLDEDFTREQSLRERDFNQTQSRRQLDFKNQLVDDANHFAEQQAQSKQEFAAKAVQDKEQFDLDQARRQEDFTNSQAQARINFEQELKDSYEQETIKLARSLEAHQLTRQRAIDDNNLAASDRKEAFDKELADINQQLHDKADMYSLDISSYKAYQDSLTALTAQGVAERSEIQNQRDAWWMDNSVTSRAFGGIVPGPLGMPRTILAHGGETIKPPPNANYFNNVRYGDQFSQRNTMHFTANGGNANDTARQAMTQVGRMLRLDRAMNGAT